MEASTTATTEFSLNFVRAESSQLFFMFTGLRHPQAGDALQFMRDSGLANRNVVFVKDPYLTRCYLWGLSEEYASLDGIVAWQRQLLTVSFPHVRELFCMGASAGGGAALHAACRLDARAAWVFGGRLVKTEILEERNRVARQVYLRLLGRPALTAPTPAERARLIEAFKDPALRRQRWDLTGNPDRLVDHEAVRRLVDVVRECSATTELHLHFATTNVIDRQFAEAFVDCPSVCLHPIDPPPASIDDITFEDPGHAVLLMLQQMGRVQTLFEPFLRYQ